MAGDLRVNLNSLVVDTGVSGYVGIGITNPDTELDVNGVIQARNDMVVQGNLIIKGTNASSGDLNAIWQENIYGEAYLLKTAIGIGITDPQYEVDVVGDINFTGTLFRNGDVLNIGSGGWATSGTNVYYNAGNVGIGITAPTNGKIHIAGEYGTVGLSANSYSEVTTTGAGLGDAGTFAYSVYASGKVAASAFHAVSDKRVKTIIDTRDNSADKLAIEELNVYNYKYIDTPQYGSETKIGIMAQDVELISKDLVQETKRYIPSMYADFPLKSVNEIEVGEQDIKVGDKVRLQYKIEGQYEMVDKEVLAYENGVMTVSESANDEHYDVTEAFVYGKQVDDFKAVNFEQLTSLNTSALKAVIAENKALKEELAAIKEFIGMSN